MDRYLGETIHVKPLIKVYNDCERPVSNSVPLKQMSDIRRGQFIGRHCFTKCRGIRLVHPQQVVSEYHIALRGVPTRIITAVIENPFGYRACKEPPCSVVSDGSDQI